MGAKPDPRSSERARLDTSRTIARTIFAVTSIGLVVNIVVKSSSLSIPGYVLTVGAGVVAVIAGSVYIFMELQRARFLELRVALTGAPGVGKTVLANVLFDRLMTHRSNGSRVSFTAESSTGISVYQAIRGIEAGVWPRQTDSENVYRYSGQIEYVRSQRSAIVDLELGDSAGEHWIELVGELTLDVNRSRYLEYVITADALMHVISCESLMVEGLGAQLRRELHDLTLAAQLMRANGGKPEQTRVLLVLSKADLVLEREVAEDYGLPALREMRCIVRKAMVMDIARLDEISRTLQHDQGDLGLLQLSQALKLVCDAAEQIAGTFGDVRLMLTSVFSQDSDEAAFEPQSADEIMEWVRRVAVGRRRSRGR